MRVFTLAAGLATGYVLGSRAGREKYEQIVAGYQKLSSHPTVVQTQEKAKQRLTSSASTAISKLDPTAPDTQPELPVTTSKLDPPTVPDTQSELPPTTTVRPRRKAAATTPDPFIDPLA